jgi:hypothetical protein
MMLKLKFHAFVDLFLLSGEKDFYESKRFAIPNFISSKFSTYCKGFSFQAQPTNSKTIFPRELLVMVTAKNEKNWITML